MLIAVQGATFWFQSILELEVHMRDKWVRGIIGGLHHSSDLLRSCSWVRCAATNAGDKQSQCWVLHVTVKAIP